MDQMMLLTRRVYRLEQELARLKGAPLEEIADVAPGPLPPPPPFERKPAASVSQPITIKASEPGFEADLVAKWFARIGAVALVIGAGFAFKYGIDRGYIGPGARVIIGIVAGIAMCIWGEWSHRRGWHAFSQAVVAAGVATMMLSVWAAYHLYEFLSAGPTFALLFAITLNTVLLALRYDSQALAVLASIGAFLDPLIVGGRDHPPSLYGYILVIDAGIVTLAALKRWPSLDVLATAASWALFGAAADKATTGVALGYASALFALFSIGALATENDETLDIDWRAILIAMNGAIYLVAGLAILQDRAQEARGAFAAFVAAAELVLATVIQRLRPDKTSEAISSVIAMVSVTIAVGLQWHGLDASIAWAVEAAFLAVAGTLMENRFLRVSSLAVIALSAGSSLAVHFEYGQAYQPGRILLSRESAVFVAQIVCALTLASLLRRGRETWERQAAAVSLVGANVLAVIWLSFEAYAHYRGGSLDLPFDQRQAFQFTLSAIWGLYAAGLLAIGIAARAKSVRLMSIALFSLTIFKMAVADLWTLTTGYRTLAFIGLGVVLLLTSLSYHRFRELILGPSEPPAQG